MSGSGIASRLKPQLSLSVLIRRQQKHECAAAALFTLNPDLPPVRLDEPLRNGQPQPHSGGISVHSHELLKNLLMVLRGNPPARSPDFSAYAQTLALSSQQANSCTMQCPVQSES